MFQKMFDGAGVVFSGSQRLASDMNQIGFEEGFGRLRRQEAARKNRSTADSGMFCRRARRRA